MSETIAEPVLCHWTGKMGHFTFAWDQGDDTKAETMIKEAMASGIVFRIVKRGSVFGRTPRNVVLTSVEDIGDDRKVILEDKDVARFFSAGIARPVATVTDDDDDNLPEPAAPPAPPRARTAQEVRENETIAHRPLVGG